MRRQRVCGLIGRWPTAVALTALAAILALALAAPGSRAQKSQTPTRAESAAERKAEFEALKQRAENLAPQLKAVSLAPSKNDPKSKWAKLLADFDQWAHKFNAPTQEKVVGPVAGPGGPPLPPNCPVLTEGPPGISGYLNLKDLSRSDLMRCVYKCYRE